MTDSHQTQSSGPAVQAAAEAFMSRLAWTGLIGHVDRLETVLLTSETDAALKLDRVVAAAWPPSAGSFPRHEVVLGRQTPTENGVNIAAFDGSGRVLLRKRYGWPQRAELDE